MDVGQGDAIAIRFPNRKTMLVDSGPATNTKDLLTYLDNVFFEKSEKHFDYVMLSHPDSDHSAGLLSVLREYSIGIMYRNVYLEGEDNPKSYTTTSNEDYIKAVDYAKNNGIALVDREVGDTIEEGGVTVQWVGPVKQYTESNQNSMVLHLQYNSTGVLISGDSEYNELKDVFENKTYDVDLLKVGHHGSKNSLVGEDEEDTILNHIQPQYAVISVGDNSYGHPHKETIERLENIGSKIMSTPESGAITLKIGRNIRVYEFRKS